MVACFAKSVIGDFLLYLYLKDEAQGDLKELVVTSASFQGRNAYRTDSRQCDAFITL